VDSPCIECGEREGEVWFCGEGAVCEPCYRLLGDVPDDVMLEFDADLKLSDDLGEYTHRVVEHLEHPPHEH
jgi:hypothetical protein